MSKVRIVFLGTPHFAATSLEKLISDEHFEIVGVITQPDRPAGRNMKLTPSPVKVLAEKNCLKVFNPQTVNTPEFLAEIQGLKAESAAVVAFGQILGQNFLDLFPLGCVNVHGSILPRWRGAAPIQRAIMNDDRESGVSLQLIVKKLDAGDVLGSRKVIMNDEMNAIDLYEELEVLGSELLAVEYMDYLRGHIIGHPQDESLVTIAPKIAKSEAKIDWQSPARKIFCQIRGLAMGPSAYCVRDGKNLKIHKTQIRVTGQMNKSPGQIIEVGADTLTVACGTDALEILELQPESKAKMTTADYLRGYPLKKGDMLI